MSAMDHGGELPGVPGAWLWLASHQMAGAKVQNLRGLTGQTVNACLMGIFKHIHA